MVENLCEYYSELCDKSQRLIEMTQRDQWDDFIVLVNDHIDKLRILPGLTAKEMLSDQETSNIKAIVSQLLGNEEKIVSALAARRYLLKKTISGLYKGARVSQFYALR